MTRPVLAEDWIRYQAERRPSATALIDDHRDLALSYAELDDRVQRLAVWLDGRGVGAGDRVAVLSHNTTDVFEVLFACGRLRAILVPLNWRLAIPELEFIVEDCRPRVLVYGPEFADAAASLATEVTIELGADYAAAKAESDPTSVALTTATHEDPWAILYTSGTTGRPKGAVITHGMVFWNAISCIQAVGLTLDATFLNVGPTYHVAGLNMFATPCLYLGARVVHLRQFDAGRVLDWLTSGEITHFTAVAAVYRFLLEHDDWAGADLSMVQRWDCGGAPLPVAVLEQYADRGVLICQGMGLTETGPAVFVNDETHVLTKKASVGQKVLHTEVRIVDAGGNDVAPGGVGELWVRGPNVTPGYWERPEANEVAFTDGWLHTGDAARIDDDGYAYIVDRWNDMFISGGENVYPAEVEQALHHHPDVRDVAVIGVPDERWGEVGMAVVVPTNADSFDEHALLAFCEDRLARYKIPKHVTTVDELPRNGAGKVLKNDLRQAGLYAG